jgi:ketosteroid isomerase-like protein
MTEMSIEAKNLVTVYQFIDAYNRNVRKAYEEFTDDEFEWREYPGPLFPHGRSGGRREIFQAISLSEKSADDASIKILSSIVSGDLVALETIYETTIKVDLPTVPKGTRIEARMAMFLRVKNCKIASSHEYVCVGSMPS